MNLLEAFDELNKINEAQETKTELEAKIKDFNQQIDEIKVKELNPAVESMQQLEDELDAKQQQIIQITNDRNTKSQEIYNELLGHTVSLSTIVRKQTVDQEIELTPETFSIEDFGTKENPEKILQVKQKTKDGTSFTPITDSKVNKDEEVTNLIKPLVDDAQALAQLEQEIERLKSKIQFAKKETIHTIQGKIYRVQDELNKATVALEKLTDKDTKRAQKIKDHIENDLQQSVAKVKQQVQTTDSLYEALGWLAKHVIELRIVGPESAKETIESIYGPGYTIRYSNRNDWPGGTMFCDKPISSNSAVDKFVSLAIEAANIAKEENPGGARILNFTKPIGPKDRSTNCLDLVCTLISTYHFKLGNDAQPVDDIRPTNPKDAAEFDRGYNA